MKVTGPGECICLKLRPFLKFGSLVTYIMSLKFGSWVTYIMSH